MTGEEKRWHSVKNSRKGSYIVEAAIVLPMVILAVITIVLIIMFFYSQVTERSAMHIALRHGAGEAAGKTVYTGDEAGSGRSGGKSDESDVYVDRGIVESEAYGKRYLMLENRGLLEKRSPFIIEGKCVAVDGAAYIRYRNVIKVTGDEK